MLIHYKYFEIIPDIERLELAKKISASCFDVKSGCLFIKTPLPEDANNFATSNKALPAFVRAFTSIVIIDKALKFNIQ